VTTDKGAFPPNFNTLRNKDIGTVPTLGIPMEAPCEGVGVGKLGGDTSPKN